MGFAWIGLSVLGSLSTFQGMWISHDAYITKGTDPLTELHQPPYYKRVMVMSSLVLWLSDCLVDLLLWTSHELTPVTAGPAYFAATNSQFNVTSMVELIYTPDPYR